MKKIIATILCVLACGCEVESETDPFVGHVTIEDVEGDLPPSGCGGGGGASTTTGGGLICDPELAFDGVSTCYTPDAGCCDMPLDTDLAGHCEKFTDGKYNVPVFCVAASGAPDLNDITCVELKPTSFACSWGASALFCCGITN